MAIDLWLPAPLVLQPSSSQFPPRDTQPAPSEPRWTRLSLRFRAGSPAHPSPQSSDQSAVILTRVSAGQNTVRRNVDLPQQLLGLGFYFL